MRPHFKTVKYRIKETMQNGLCHVMPGMLTQRCFRSPWLQTLVSIADEGHE